MKFHYCIVKTGVETAVGKNNHDINFVHANSEMLLHVQSDTKYVPEYRENIQNIQRRHILPLWYQVSR